MLFPDFHHHLWVLVVCWERYLVRREGTGFSSLLSIHLGTLDQSLELLGPHILEGVDVFFLHTP